MPAGYAHVDESTPLGLSGSRGVIRADSPAEWAAAFDRISALLARVDVRAARTGLESEVLVERFIEGAHRRDADAIIVDL